MTTPSGGLVGDGSIRITADTDPALRALNQFTRDAEGRLRDTRGRFVSEARLMNNALTSVGQTPTRITVDTDDATNQIRSFATGALRSIASVASSVGLIGAALGTAIPVAAGLAATIANIAPAGAAAATGIIAIRQATATVQLAMIGVEDSITAAFETGEGSAEAFQESLERLSPSARAFAVEVRGMREEFVEFQQGVQDRFFEGFAGELNELSTTVLPLLQNGFNVTANVLNDMALSASDAAQEIAADGTLGNAISSANIGLFNLRDIPAQILTAFFQLGAAGGPIFESLTSAAADAATGISERLSAAFESGALQDAVNTAFDLILQLGTVVGDIFTVIGNTLGAVGAGGGDLIGVLGTLFSTLAQFTGTEAFQQAISSLAQTMGSLAETAAPLLISALEIIAPIFTNLAGPVQTLIADLGAGLSPIITALGPVLDAASVALGQLVLAISPLLPIIGNLIAQMGPILTPILEAVGEVITLLAPVVLSLAQTLSGALSPILAALPGVIQPILDALIELISAVIPILNQLIVELTPVMNELSASFVELLIALSPLIVQLLRLATDVLVLITPLIGPIIRILTRLSSVFTADVAGTITNIVIPAINAITALLRGDFRSAFENARTVVFNVLSSIIDRFTALPGLIISAIASLGSRLFSSVSSAGGRMVDAVRNRISDALGQLRDLPSRAAGALGNLGSVLYSEGRELIQGFIDGIQSMFGSVGDSIGSLVDSVTGWLPGSPAEVGPLSGSGYVYLRGRRFSEDFARGIGDEEATVSQATAGIASAASVGVDQTSLRALPIGTVPTAAQAQTAVPLVVNLNLTNQGVLGSQADVMNWLARAIDELGRLQRLPRGRTV